MRRKVKITDGQQPFDFMLPKTTWITPSQLPDLSGEKLIAIDTEGYDPNLKTRGPGYLRGDAFVCGIGVATQDAKWYFPYRHAGGNLDRNVVVAWAKDQFKSPDRDVVFANAPYDLGALRSEGIEVGGRIHDITITDPLIDEERHDGYSLNALCMRWLGEKKAESGLQVAANAYGYENAKKCMHKLHSKFVGVYGQEDPWQTLRIHLLQQKVIEQQGLGKIYSIEQRLIRVLFEMYWQGIRVDREYAERLNEEWRIEEQRLYLKLGFSEIWDAEACGRYLRKFGHNVGRSVTKEIITACGGEEAELLRKARELAKCRKDYLEGFMIDFEIKGRLHPQYVQLHTDEGGTRSGRLACKLPNLQQTPKRSLLIDSKAIRKALRPEPGEEWAKLDYWSQEPIIQCHYGLVENMEGARECAEKFAQGIKLANFIMERSNNELNYADAKDLTLARSYGQQVKSLARKKNITIDRAKYLQTCFDNAVPFISQLADKFAQTARRRGYIRTLGGRHRHFNQWHPVQPPTDWSLPKELRDEAYFAWKSECAKACDLERARLLWGQDVELERGFVYKAFNGGTQGSAADQTKIALVNIYEQIGIPNLTVHDEINKSIKSREEAYHMKELMEGALKMALPARADLEFGDSWF